MVKPKGYYSKEQKAIRSANYKKRLANRVIDLSRLFGQKRKYTRSGKYKGMKEIRERKKLFRFLPGY